MIKKVLITGASSGLGLSHAVYLISKGFEVTGTTRNLDNLDLEKLKHTYLRDHLKYKIIDKETLMVRSGKSYLPKSILDNIDDLLEKINFKQLDIRDQSNIEEATLEIWKEKPVDVLINNAGIGYFGPAEFSTEKEMQNQFETNYFGHIRMIRANLPLMRNRGSGLIINTSSLGGMTGIPYQAHYSGSKAAIIKFTESLKLELRNQPVNVCTIDPGDINTNFNAETAKLININQNITSIDLNTMVEALNVKNDAYKPDVEIVWRNLVKNLIVSPPPIVISKTIEKIIHSRNPKVHYQSGNLLQRVGVPLLNRIFTQNLAVRITGMFYGL